MMYYNKFADMKKKFLGTIFISIFSFNDDLRNILYVHNYIYIII